MEHLASIGIFFDGLGVFLISCGFFWFISIYEKINTPKEDRN